MRWTLLFGFLVVSNLFDVIRFGIEGRVWFACASMFVLFCAGFALAMELTPDPPDVGQ